MKKAKPLIYDSSLLNRIKQYLEDNVDRTYLDVGEMTKHLQERYAEYSKRKFVAFRDTVNGAYKHVTKSYGLTSCTTSGDESNGSDLELMDDVASKSNSFTSNMLNNLYDVKAPKSGGKTGPTAESINIISSDESDDEQISSNGQTQRGICANDISRKNVVPTFREVTVSKVPGFDVNAKNSIAESSSTMTGMKHGAQKRMEMETGAQEPSLQPTSKKHKRDNNAVNNVQTARQLQRNQSKAKGSTADQLKQQQQHHQQFKALLNNANSNDAGGKATNNAQRPKKFKKEVVLRKSNETFHDIGGMEKTLKELCELLMHINSPDIYFVLGLMPPRGILLHGPPGCGKTLLAHAIAGQLNLPIVDVAATELIAGVSGESEERIREVFEQASLNSPCILFIDEIDAISANRNFAHKDMERRIVSQLISSMDALKLLPGGQSVVVIGATTRPDVLDPALRRVGRFDHEIAIGIPSRKDRREILKIICDGLSMESRLDYDKIAELTPGFVGADLLALVSRAATIAVKKKSMEQMRAHQLKAQRNMAIVNLDDEGEENDAAVTDGTNAKDGDKKQANEAEKAKQTNEAEDASAKAQLEDKQKEQATTTAEVASMEVDDDDVAAETPKTAEDAAKKTAEAETEADAKDEEMKTAEKENDAKETQENGTTKAVLETAENAEEKISEEKISEEKISEEKITEEKLTEEKNEEAIAKLAEPSLFELLNWLDNPPEDIACCTYFCITFEDFKEAVKVVQPSAKREGFITVPNVTWADVGALSEVRDELKLAVLAPVKYPQKLERLGLSAPSGVLLCGPPGCGKTLIAKAIANEAGINFISVKGPELMNMYVGVSEGAVRACFQRARNSAPCVIFFDEFDSLCPKRSDANEGGSGTRIVNQLLTEMDGIEERQGVYILAATNRPDIIDPAILRPGRLDTILYVGMPKEDERAEILKATTKNRTQPVLDADVNFSDLAKQTDGYTGADLAGLVKQAAMLALKENLLNALEDSNDDLLCVRKTHFDQAINMLCPSVTPQDRKIYDKLRLKYAAPCVPQLISD